MRAVLTSLVLCAGLAAAAVSAGCSQGGAGVADGLQTKPAATAAATEASPTVVWRTGHAHEYRFEVVSTATVTGAVPTRVVARGTLEIVPRQRANDVELALRVTKATIELSGGADAGPGEELGRALESAPFAAALTRGSITALRVARDTPELVINLQRTLMSALQFSVSTEEAAGSWNAEEWDSTGRYRARYAPGDAAGLFQRDKLEYKAVARGGSVGRSGLELAAPRAARPSRCVTMRFTPSFSRRS